MKKGDEVYAIDSNNVYRTNITDKRTIQYEGQPAVTEYLVSIGFIEQDWLTSDSLFLTSGEAQTAWLDKEVKKTKLRKAQVIDLVSNQSPRGRK